MSEHIEPTLRLEVDGPVGWIIADNAARMNAFTARMWGLVPKLVAEVEAHAGVRIIILRGAGQNAFSAGADISEFDSARSGEAAVAYDGLNHAAFNAMICASKPTIAMIHGFCLGGGLALAACCDLRLCDDKATFAIPAAKLGIGYNPRWLRQLLAILPPPRVKEILFTAHRFSAADALAMGLVNRMTTVDALEGHTRALAAEIAANAPLTIRAAKHAVDALTRGGPTADLAPLDEEIAACFSSADYAEGRRAFLEKRKPKFSGR